MSSANPERVDLRGKVVLVTGAARRLGQSIALAFAREGARLALHSHGSSLTETLEAVRAFGADAWVFSGDLRDSAVCRRLARDVITTAGGVDVLVSSAANFERIPFDALDDAALDRALDLNVRATYALVHEARDSLRERRGSVLLVTCTSTAQPYANYLPYIVSKAAARQLMRGLAIELAPHVRVNAVAPGTVLPPESMPEAERHALVQRTLLKTAGSPGHVAQALVDLARAPWTTGQELFVDGGVTLAGWGAGEG